MKKFVQKLFIFLAFPGLIIILSDLFYRSQNSVYQEKYEGAIENKDSLQVVILGNSHATYGVDPNAFDLYAYNLANVNQSLYFDKRITLQLLDRAEKIRYVLISLDYHSFYLSDQGIRNTWSYYGNGIKYKDHDYLLKDLSPFLFGYPPKFTLSVFKNQIVSWVKNGEGYNYFDVQKGVNPLEPMMKGYVGYEGTDQRAFTSQKMRSRAKLFNEKHKDVEVKNEVIKDLRNFIETLIQNDITPILFTSPTYENYNKHLSKRNILSNDKEIRNLCKEYNLEYWNFMESKLFKKLDFYDSDHLNKQGAYKFGKILNDSLQKLDNYKNPYSLEVPKN